MGMGMGMGIGMVACFPVAHKHKVGWMATWAEPPAESAMDGVRHLRFCKFDWVHVKSRQPLIATHCLFRTCADVVR